MSYGQYSNAPMGRGDGSVIVPASKAKRQKTVFDTDEIAHLWAHRTQDAARNPQGNFYFSGDTIYSYGSHFPIARHIKGAHGADGVFFTSRSYSNTTAKHVSYTRRSLPDSV